MRKPITSVLVLLAFFGILHAEPPTFTLSKAKTGGSLHWLLHGSHHFPSPYDHIRNDPNEKSISIGLGWSTEPDEESGELLAARFYWEIQKSELKRTNYEIAVKSFRDDTVVFELKELESKNILLVSPEVKLMKMIRGDASTIARHAHIIDLSDLIDLDEPIEQKGEQ